MSMNFSNGSSYPLGATPMPGGVNFSLYSKNATEVHLLLFDDDSSPKPAQTIKLHARKNRSYHYWHVFVPGIQVGQIYGYRVNGPFDLDQGFRFDPEKVLLDPYGKAVAVPERWSRAAASQPGDNAAQAMKSIVADPTTYDWEGDAPLARPFADTVIYEMHVRGFTKHASSGLPPEKRGTYAGLIEKIPYLLDLGVTAVELLPIFQFDYHSAPLGLVNYWGYDPVSFFAPHLDYSISKNGLKVLDEFRDMVKALHRAGIEVILDVVYNHTAEGSHEGPTISFRGLANNTYYLLKEDKAEYSNYSGTGNTLNANNPIVRKLICDSLRYWVQEMHVDGFRFDLASILARDESGKPIENPPVLWEIESDPVLARTKLIAEAWDAAGLYQVGSFIGDSWKEWNGRFRDDIRAFLRGDRNSVGKLATRLLGSPDLYGHEEREPEQSIHFVTCHDGFTLNDLVSYNKKHNSANAEDNLDGEKHNLSRNYGVEGPSDDPDIELLRNRQVKNFIAINLLAIGAPMLLMGDEIRRTQNGNNNAYCQDNEISWFDWSLLERHRDVHRFVRFMISTRMQDRERHVTLNELLRDTPIYWHGVKLGQPDWNENSHSLAITVDIPRTRLLMHIMLNAFREPLKFELPIEVEGKKCRWRRWFDTSLPSPEDISEWKVAPVISESTYKVAPYSVSALFARGNNGRSD